VERVVRRLHELSFLVAFNALRGIQVRNRHRELSFVYAKTKESAERIRGAQPMRAWDGNG
jgi:hypothetical protein